MDPERSGELCTRCAMCCDGTLFSHVDISAEEATRLAAAGVVLETDEAGSCRLPQGCSGLMARRCTVYEVRPAKCRAFRCGVLSAMEQGALSFNDADALLAEARALIDALGLRERGKSVLKTLLYAQWRNELPERTPELERLDLLLQKILARPAEPSTAQDEEALLREAVRRLP